MASLTLQRQLQSEAPLGQAGTAPPHSQDHTNDPTNRTERQRLVRSRRAPQHHRCAQPSAPGPSTPSGLCWPGIAAWPAAAPSPLPPVLHGRCCHPRWLEGFLSDVSKRTCATAPPALGRPPRARARERTACPRAAVGEGESVSILLYSNEVIFLEILYYVDFLYSCRFVLPDNLFAFPPFDAAQTGAVL